ncbi:MAG: CapA family protein, partial [Ruminococcus sp.]|nr:CapA family protein [Ruminococcus sp.]
MKLRKGRVAGAVIILTALVGTAVSCVGRTVEKMNYDVTASQTTVVTTTTTTEPTTLPPPEDKVIHVVAVGDNLVQTAVYRNAQRHATDGTYDFLPLYENVRDIIESGDISIINQETLIANGEYEVSGSNFNFNSPVELGDDMIDLGFNVFTLANNHLMDKGTGGLEATHIL